MKKYLVAAAVALILGACSAPGSQSVPAAPATQPPTTAPAASQPEPKCFEDEPCWDCETMGNGVCGPVPQAVKECLWAWAADPSPTKVTSSEAGAECEELPTVTGLQDKLDSAISTYFEALELDDANH